MAFETAIETWASDLNKTLDRAGKVTRTATRVMTSVTGSPTTDNESTAEAAFPTLYSIHPRLGVAFTCRDVRIRRQSPVLYEATLTYRSEPTDDPNASGYPWDEPADVYFYDISETAQVDFDADGEPIQTTAGEPFTIPMEFADQGIRVVKNFLGYSAASFYTYRRSVNSDTFLGFAPGILRVAGITGDPARHESGVLYYKVTVNIAARSPYQTTDEKAWHWRGINQGNWVNVDGKIKEATFPKSNITGGPLPINSAGDAVLGPSDTRHFLEFRRYTTIAFAGMGLF